MKFSKENLVKSVDMTNCVHDFIGFFYKIIEKQKNAFASLAISFS